MARALIACGRAPADALVAALLDAGHDVVCVCEEGDAAATRRLGALGVEAWLGPDVDWAGDGALPDRATLLAELSPALLVLDGHARAAQWLPLLGADDRPAIVIDAGHLELLRSARRLLPAPGGQLGILEIRALRQELNAYSAADAVLVADEHDRALVDLLSARDGVARLVPPDAARAALDAVLEAVG